MKRIQIITIFLVFFSPVLCSQHLSGEAAIYNRGVRDLTSIETWKSITPEIKIQRKGYVNINFNTVEIFIGGYGQHKEIKRTFNRSNNLHDKYTTFGEVSPQNLQLLNDDGKQVTLQIFNSEEFIKSHIVLSEFSTQTMYFFFIDDEHRHRVSKIQ